MYSYYQDFVMKKVEIDPKEIGIQSDLRAIAVPKKLEGVNNRDILAKHVANVGMDALAEKFDYRGKGVEYENFIQHFVDLLDEGSFAKKSKKKKKKRNASFDNTSDEEREDELEITAREEIAGQVHMLFRSKDEADRKMKKEFPRNSSGLTKSADFEDVLDSLGFEFSKRL